MLNHRVDLDMRMTWGIWEKPIFIMKYRIKNLSLRPVLVALALGLAACGPADIPPGDLINDPHEAQNREFHELNITVDRALLRPVSQGYGTIVPEPVRNGLSNMASNLNQPGYVVNNILQFRIGQAMQNTTRFLINSTIGIGGLFDPASARGVLPADTNFGETLHVWGAEEGAYVELPFFGPSTTRDTAGRVVDVALNPLRYLVTSPESDYVTGLETVDLMGQRYQFGDVIDGVLYESEDSYAQARSLYLQNRRFELRGDRQQDDYFDPYEDPYAQ